MCDGGGSVRLRVQLSAELSEWPRRLSSSMHKIVCKAVGEACKIDGLTKRYCTTSQAGCGGWLRHYVLLLLMCCKVHDVVVNATATSYLAATTLMCRVPPVNSVTLCELYI
jgi:hypothetical protein